jgi:hypothetical protein
VVALLLIKHPRMKTELDIVPPIPGDSIFLSNSETEIAFWRNTIQFHQAPSII